MAKFKIGDHVQYARGVSTIQHLKTGRIIATRERGRMFDVRWDDGSGSYGAYAENLERVKKEKRK